MLAKKYRLVTRDVHYLAKKQRCLSFGYFGFYTVIQRYRTYNQFSVHVWLKVHKRAVQRNMLKRIVFSLIQDKSFVTIPFGNRYYKVFVVVSKQGQLFFHNLVATKDRNAIKHEVSREFLASFSRLETFLWKK